MEDECSIGNDETRCFILSSYATHKMNKVPCVLCNTQMIIFERWASMEADVYLDDTISTRYIHDVYTISTKVSAD